MGAPELADGVRPGPQQDVYQMGLCILSAFTFFHPYRYFGLPQQICKAQLQRIKPPELALLRDKDPLAADLISRCLDPLESRITLEELLRHPYIVQAGEKTAETANSTAGSSVPVAGGAATVVASEKAVAGAASEASNIRSSGSVGPAAAAATGAAPHPSTDLFMSPTSSDAVDNLPLHASVPGTNIVRSNVVSPTSSTASVIEVPSSSTAPVLNPSKRIKCYVGRKSAEAGCIVIALDESVQSVGELRNVIDVDFGEELENVKDLSLRYRDIEGDAVIVTQRTTLQEIRENAVCLELHEVQSGKKE